MEKTIIIDGRNIRFKATGSAPLRYKMQFRRDFFADMIKLEKSFKLMDGTAKLKGNKNDIDSINLDAFDSECIYNICWVFAKIADDTIPTPMEWLDTFNEFPLMDIVPEIQDLLYASVTTSKQSKN